MTAIVAIGDGKKVWMGADSLTALGWDSAIGTRPKVCKCGPFLVGVTGYARISQIIEFKLKVEDDPRRDGYAFVCIEFADRLRQILQECGAKTVKENADKLLDSAVLIGFRGQVYTMASDFGVVDRTDNIGAVGCGGAFALGSLHETEKRKMSPEDRIISALESAERFSCGVRGPFTVLSL